MSNASFVATINNVTLQYPQFPLLLEPSLLNDSFFCNGHSLKEHQCLNVVNATVCKCIHLLRVKLDSNVELVIYNLNDKISHPMHLHGHKFHVVDTGLFEDINVRSELKKKTDFSKDRPAFKDTVVLPFPGYVRLRFRADNPGFWLLHCHFDWHISIGKAGKRCLKLQINVNFTGMALIIQVGDIDEMPKPPASLPRCHPYIPNSLY